MRTLFVMFLNPVDAKSAPVRLEHLYEEREVMKETPTGFQLRSLKTNFDSTHFYGAKHYRFFDTEVQALEYLASECNRIAGVLEERKLETIRRMADCHDAIKALKETK
ncbi:TPA: hypothetical protein LU109_003578 [Enterobacter hormaechei subsp. xiangfangensis]|nr:hypothetical protein [Enterobacter hormaechei subsp. xiangfangensis]